MTKKALLFLLTVLLLQNIHALIFEPNIILVNNFEDQSSEEIIKITNDQKNTQTNLELNSKNENIAKAINKPISLLPRDSLNKTIKLNPQKKGYYYTSLNINNQKIPVYLAVSSSTKFNITKLYVEKKELVFEIQNLDTKPLKVSIFLKTLNNKTLAKSTLNLDSEEKRSIPTKIPNALLPTNYVVIFESETQVFLNSFKVPTVLNNNQLLLLGILIPLIFGILMLVLKHKKKRINL